MHLLVKYSEAAKKARNLKCVFGVFEFLTSGGLEASLKKERGPDNSSEGRWRIFYIPTASVLAVTCFPHVTLQQT